MKVAFTTVLDDKYLTGFLITLKSMLDSSPDFNYDLIILEWGELSDTSKDIIKKLYNNVIFKMVDVDSYKDHEYDKTYRVWTYNCNHRFDIFTFTEYDRVVFFDSDIVFEVNVNEILKHDVDFGACCCGKNIIAQINDRVGFNCGLMSIGKKYLNQQTKQNLIEIAKTPAPNSKKIKTNKWVSDEPILNTYFLDKVTWLPENFNFLVRKLQPDSFDTPKNYHFSGIIKPWDNNKENFDKHVIEEIYVNISNVYTRLKCFKKILNKVSKYDN